MLRRVVDRIERRFADSKPAVTGISDLDELLSPLESGDMLIITARHLVDITTLALQVVVRAARSGRHVTVVVRRGSMELIAERLLVLVSGVDGRRVTHGRLNGLDWHDLGGAIAQLERHDIRLLELDDDQADTSVPLLPLGADTALVDTVLVFIGMPARWRVTPVDHSGAASGDRPSVVVAASDEVIAAYDGRVAEGHLADSCRVRLRRSHDQVSALVTNSYGWHATVPLHERPGGRGYFGAAAGRDENRAGDGGED